MEQDLPTRAAGPARGSSLMQPVGCTAVGMAGNIVLTAGKIALGFLAGSSALIADGFHSLADVLSDIGILLSLKAASRPPDANHPYGHHSFETLGAVIVAGFMILTAFLIGRGAVQELLHGNHPAPRMLAFWVSLVSVATKELMARYTLIVGRHHNSPALVANGVMHRSDAISSTAAATGIGLSQLGMPQLDSAAALVIALFIARIGWGLLRENMMTLMDTMPDPQLVEAVKEAAERVPCVQEVRDVKARQRGSCYLADLCIAVHPGHTIGAAHDISHQVVDSVLARVDNVARVFVHVEPGEADTAHVCPQKQDTDEAVNDAAPDHPEPR